ncbi:hypothetical protein IVA79_08180 [Bradyrhizobium sp. 138]|uniref:hypothetical protein n=1 Tax=Bradyrhizobium sp. 138 TaxID=2782615 RepID=UPI001FFB60B6|nr:hypothetical protein [Bradyrhizobium sp. 138]MCK1733933.1 hypothetical protein [Bradyrhizobium sp. 138]
MIVAHASWNAPWRETFCIFALLSMLVAAPALLIIFLLDSQLVLPAVSLLFFSDAMITALLALAKSGAATVGKISLWDIAGAFTMIGCAAAILGEPDQVALLFGQTAGPHSDAAAGDSYLSDRAARD